MKIRQAKKICNHVYEYVNWFLIDPLNYSEHQIRSAMKRIGVSDDNIKFDIHYFLGKWKLK